MLPLLQRRKSTLTCSFSCEIGLVGPTPLAELMRELGGSSPAYMHAQQVNRHAQMEGLSFGKCCSRFICFLSACQIDLGGAAVRWSMKVKGQESDWK